MAYALSIFLTAGCLVHVWQHWNRLFGEGNPVVRREFLLWLLKGHASPLTLWILLNAGLLPGFPPIP